MDDLPFDVEEIDDVLDKYEQEKAGLPPLTKMQGPEYLNIPLEQLRKKTLQELSEATVLLSQYRLYLQRRINRNKAWEKWIINKLDELTAYHLQQISSDYGFNERPIIARNSPEICKKLNSYLREIRMEMERLYDTPQNIGFLIEAIRDMKFMAMRRDKDSQHD